MDDWIIFNAEERIAVIVLALRNKLDNLLLEKLSNPTLSLLNSPLLQLINQIIRYDGLIMMNSK